MTHASIVAHTLTCLPNVGPSLFQPPNLTSIWKLRYSYTGLTENTIKKRIKKHFSDIEKYNPADPENHK